MNSIRRSAHRPTLFLSAILLVWLFALSACSRREESAPEPGVVTFISSDGRWCQQTDPAKGWRLTYLVESFEAYRLLCADDSVRLLRITPDSQRPNTPGPEWRVPYVAPFGTPRHWNVEASFEAQRALIAQRAAEYLRVLQLSEGSPGTESLSVPVRLAEESGVFESRSPLPFYTAEAARQSGLSYAQLRQLESECHLMRELLFLEAGAYTKAQRLGPRQWRLSVDCPVTLSDRFRKRLHSFVARQFGTVETPASRVQFLAQIEARLFDFLRGPRVFEFEGDLRSGDAQTLIVWRQVVPAAEAKSTGSATDESLHGEVRLWALGLLFGPVNLIRLRTVE